MVKLLNKLQIWFSVYFKDEKFKEENKNLRKSLLHKLKYTIIKRTWIRDESAF